MAILHDPATLAALRARVEHLAPDARRQWGKMSVDQMLWHVNYALEMVLGRVSPKQKSLPIPKALLRFMVIKLPWTKGAPTMPEAVARAQYDFDSEKARTLKLLTDVAAKPLNSEWSPHALLGTLSGLQQSELQAKHVDHHLRQFSA